MSAVIELLKSHRSIRKFTSQPISEELFEQLVEAGQAAATSSFLQGSTIIRVRQRESRKELARLAGNQPYVEYRYFADPAQSIGKLTFSSYTLFICSEVGRQKWESQ